MGKKQPGPKDGICGPNPLREYPPSKPAYEVNQYVNVETDYGWELAQIDDIMTDVDTFYKLTIFRLKKEEKEYPSRWAEEDNVIQKLSSVYEKTAVSMINSNQYYEGYNVTTKS